MNVFWLIVRSAASKSEEQMANNAAKSPEDAVDAPSIEGEGSPKKRTTLDQKCQGQNEGQGQSGDTPTGSEMRGTRNALYHS